MTTHMLVLINAVLISAVAVERGVVHIIAAVKAKSAK